MVRHASAERRRRGEAAEHLHRLRRGSLFFQLSNDSREISFHDSLPCLQNRIVEEQAEQSSKEARAQSPPVCIRDTSTPEVWDLTKWKPESQGDCEDSQHKRWQQLLLWLLMVYWFRWQSDRLSCLKIGSVRTSESKERSDHSTSEASPVFIKTCTARTNNNSVTTFFSFFFFPFILLCVSYDDQHNFSKKNEMGEDFLLSYVLGRYGFGFMRFVSKQRCRRPATSLSSLMAKPTYPSKKCVIAHVYILNDGLLIDILVRRVEVQYWWRAWCF